MLVPWGRFPLSLTHFGSLGTGINKLKSVAFTAQSNYNVQTQESINILKTKQNKTTITISRVTMQIYTNYGRNEAKKCNKSE